MSSIQSPLPNLSEPANPFSRSQAHASGCPHNNTARNLVVCIDGTANQFSAKSTNIIELFSRLVKDEEGQLAFYNSGIGTYAKPSFRSFGYLKQVVYHTIDMAIAWNFERIVHAAYEWLSENYQPGDRIYLFGFSRGAYQVRVIAGMIHKVGLLHKGNKNQIPFAYELYASITERTKRESEVKPSVATSSNNPQSQPDDHAQMRDADIENDHKLCSQFKATLCRKDVKVHFVGAWDTVSSIGVLRGKSLPETVSGMGHVCAFRHALALDERRVKFQPEYANGGLGPERGDRGDVKEVWFAGSHSDIGGGNVSNEDLSNFGPALRWMTYEAMTHGLRMNPYEGKWTTVVSKPSLTGIWHFLELLPFPCLSYEDRDSLTFLPHLGAPRLIKQRQLIHQSVFTRSKPSEPLFTPNAPNEDSDSDSESTVPTEDAFGAGESSTDDGDDDMAIHPPTQDIDIALSLLSDSVTLSDPSSDVAPTDKIPGAFPGSPPSGPLSLFPSAILPTVDGRKFDWEVLFKSYQNESIVEKDPFEDASHTLDSLETICDTLGLRLQDSGDKEPIDFNPFIAAIITLRSFLDDASRLPSFTEVPNAAPILLSALELTHEHHFLDVETRRTILRLLSHARAIELLGDRKYTTLQIRDWVKPFGGEFSALPLTFGNPRHARGFIEVWRRDGSPPHWALVHQIIVRHRSSISSLVFSSADNSKLAYTKGSSSSMAMRDLAEPLRGRQETILRGASETCALINSPSGEWLVSAHQWGVIKIWSAETTLIVHDFVTEDRPTTSLAFRPDGKVLANGSSRRIQLWSCTTWEWIYEFDVATSMVVSLYFSLDGKQLVSGSRDTVQLWDVETGDFSSEEDNTERVTVTKKSKAQQYVWLEEKPKGVDSTYNKLTYSAFFPC
ncbi:hypothetical protein ONZ45_g7105 [Pleurotus djamor]|nr:hypothetical protein ONZ45_g7105 [Pleurotus djamor]